MQIFRALVTGGTKGIGEAIVTTLTKAGVEVWCTGTRSDPPSHIDRKHYLQCDFTNLSQVESLCEKIAPIGFSILINNAGINKVGPVEQYSSDDFQKISLVNTTAPFLLCKAVIPGMREKKYGRIVNITSVFGVVSRSGRFAYSASKFGLLGLSRALAVEVASQGILINCVAPGFVDTELTRSILGASGMAEMSQKIPMGRLAKPQEIAEMVAFLASGKNTYMTGQNMIVDGGFVSE